MNEKAAKKERFEDFLKQVEDVVKALEGGKLGLEESIEKYETGIKALRQCYAILEQAEKKIQILVKDKDGALSARDFDPAADGPPPPVGTPAPAGKRVPLAAEANTSGAKAAEEKAGRKKTE